MPQSGITIHMFDTRNRMDYTFAYNKARYYEEYVGVQNHMMVSLCSTLINVTAAAILCSSKVDNRYRQWFEFVINGIIPHICVQYSTPVDEYTTRYIYSEISLAFYNAIKELVKEKSYFICLCGPSPGMTSTLWLAR